MNYNQKTELSTFYQGLSRSQTKFEHDNTTQLRMIHVFMADKTRLLLNFWMTCEIKENNKEKTEYKVKNITATNEIQNLN